jgi:hypothetical protein
MKTFSFLQRPSVWVGLVAALVYCDRHALMGEFVYDDAGSVKRNIVVTGQVPFRELFTRDFWGTPMKDAQSHKSYRPLTTLTFWLNYKLSESLGTLPTDHHTLGFHVVNVLLHGIVTALLAQVLELVLFFRKQTFLPSSAKEDSSASSSTAANKKDSGDDDTAATSTSCSRGRLVLHSCLLFAVHPVHAEAVSNITSRGEMLMSLFYLLALRSYFSSSSSTRERGITTKTTTKMTREHEDSALLPPPSSPSTSADAELDGVGVSQKSPTESGGKGGTIDGESSSPTAGDLKNPAKARATAATATTTHAVAVISPSREEQLPLLPPAWMVVPVLCLAASVFSKEQGATCLVSAVLADLIVRFGSVSGFVRQALQVLHRWQRHSQRQRNTNSEAAQVAKKRLEDQYSMEKDGDDQDGEVLGLVFRTAVLGLQTVAVCLARLRVNGPTRPDFIEDQNPAGFASDRVTRILSVNYVYCLYLWDFVWPANLCPDWSGRSIKLIRSLADLRALQVLALWAFVAWCFYQLLLLDLPPETRNHEEAKRSKGGAQGDDERPANRFFSMNARQKQHVLVAFWSFVACPFLLSSNLLVVVGLMKADRVVYLPLAGLCVLQAVAVDWIRQRLPHRVRPMLHLMVLLQLGLCCAKTHERNLAWSKSELLWQEAYRVNPTSYHTMYVLYLNYSPRCRETKHRGGDYRCRTHYQMIVVSQLNFFVFNATGTITATN